MATNPYTRINPQSFLLRRFGQLDGTTIFLVVLAGHKPLDACIFRRHLVDFMMAEFEGEWHLGNDDRYIRDLGNNLALGIDATADLLRLKAAFNVL